VSVVQRVLVRDGDHVEAGQPLVELDPTSASADKASIDEQLKSAQSELLRSGVLLLALARPAQAPALDKNIPAGWSDDHLRAAKAQLADEWSDIRSRLAKAAAEIQRRQARSPQCARWLPSWRPPSPSPGSGKPTSGKRSRLSPCPD